MEITKTQFKIQLYCIISNYFRLYTYFYAWGVTKFIWQKEFVSGGKFMKSRCRLVPLKWLLVVINLWPQKVTNDNNILYRQFPESEIARIASPLPSSSINSGHLITELRIKAKLYFFFLRTCENLSYPGLLQPATSGLFSVLWVLDKEIFWTELHYVLMWHITMCVF